MNFSTDTGIKYAELRKNQLDTCWQWLSSGLDWGPDDVVLDIGCGTGAYTKLLVDRGNIKSITGYDKSRDFIDVARQVNFEDGKTTYEVADATDTSTLKPEWKSAFTKAISIGVFQFIEDKKAFFKNVYMCLKPGTRNQLERLVIECGFSEVNVEEGGRYLYGNHNKEEFKNMIEVLFGQIQHIPPDRKQEFIEDAYQKLVEINHRDEKDRLCIKGLFWFLTAKK
ncbi:uncharacterized protein [Ptychodera flava]|uniref:uncharacterized protein isoform X2 n=1 Tax=Ptychodera flava TaxID=63121 RepID=UPI00396AA523